MPTLEDEGTQDEGAINEGSGGGTVPNNTIIKNDTRNVSTTRFSGGAYLFRAPYGTTLPTHFLTSFTELAEGFECLGYVSEDGFTEGVDGGSSTIADANGDIVDSYDETKTETIQFKLMEMMLEALKAQYGDANVTADGTNSQLVVKHNWSNTNEACSFVWLLLLKDKRHWTKVIPKAKLSELGEFNGNKETATGRDCTFTYLADDNGDTCIDYIEDVATGGTE